MYHLDNYSNWDNNSLADNMSINGQTVDPTEISHLDGVISNIKTQLNSKAPAKKSHLKRL
jgi:hypothetical protein